MFSSCISCSLWRRILNIFLRRGGGCSPIWMFPHTTVAFWLSLPFGQFTHHLSIPMYLWKQNLKHFAAVIVGGWGVATTPRSEREGWQRKLIILLILIFLFCPFVTIEVPWVPERANIASGTQGTIEAMFLKYLRHKVDLVGCFTFKL